MVSLAGWDINHLVFDNPKKFLAKGSCGAPPCEKTVTVGKQCHPAECVNYVLWGEMCRLCYDWIKDEGKRLLDGSTHIYYKDDTGRIQDLVILLKYDEDSALNWVLRYRTGLWGRTGVECRQAWTRVGWHYGDYDYANKVQDTSCKPCGICYGGPLSFRVGVTQGSRRDDEGTAVIEVSGNDPDCK
jgi:hypothetical protein